MNANHSDTSCPLAPMHRRLDDTHRLWHLARDSYADPDGFRVAVQNCISSLRTVTFLLQKNKQLIPDFDKWYAGWQVRMSADPLMIWAKNARNKIEKQSDLETNSSIYAEIIASYLNEIPISKVTASINETVSSIFSRIPRLVLEKQILEHGILKIERKWIDQELPQYELLDGLSYAYGQISLILDDAHRQMGIPTPAFISVKHNNKQSTYPVTSRDLKGRLPCMIASYEHRTIFISLKTGNRMDYSSRPVEFDKAQAKISAKKYNLPELFMQGQKFHSLRELADYIFKIASTMFLKDGHHVAVTFLLRGVKIVRVVETTTENRAEKYLMPRVLAGEVERYAADGIIIINEVWTSQADPENPFVYPSDMKDREEGLALLAANANEEVFQIYSKIQRRLQQGPRLDAPIVEHKGTFNIIAPIQEVWRRSKEKQPPTGARQI